MRKLIISTFLALLVNKSYASELIIENQNDTFIEFADRLANDNLYPTFDRDFLNQKHLDYSLESLHAVSDFLIDADKKNLNLQPQKEFIRLVFRAGAYVGETVRKNDKNIEWNWVEYDEANKFYPQLSQSQEKTLGTKFLLIGTNKKDSIVNFSFPLNKVLKNLENGEEDSVYAFAILQLNIQNLNKGTNKRK